MRVQRPFVVRGAIAGRTAWFALWTVALAAAYSFLSTASRPESVAIAGAQQTDAQSGQPAPKSAAPPLDPAAWGEDHVGQPLPELIESGECLFCHRGDVGLDWTTNRHGLTIHDAEPGAAEIKPLADDAATRSLVDEVTLLLGARRHVRFLRRGKDYGKLDLLSLAAERTRGGSYRLARRSGDPHWDTEHFSQHCAGCHTTGVDPQDQTFALVSLDCYACHGEATVDHSNDPKLMPLSKARKDPPRVIASVCGSCHARGGKSRATGLPYATNFVAGDNLFKDFEVDWAAADDPKLNQGDWHVLINLRQIAIEGREDMTCLACHKVHHNGKGKNPELADPRGTLRHRTLKDEAYCALCHDPARPKTEHLPYEPHNATCEY